MLSDTQINNLTDYIDTSKEVISIQEKLIEKQEAIIASLKRQIELQAEIIKILKEGK